MLNPKTHLAPLPCQQRELDICAALMGKPLGQTKIEDIQAPAEELPATTATHIDLTNLLLLPTNKVAMKAWVKQVQSTVVQVSENVKHKATDASHTMRAKMSVVGEQMKVRMAEGAAQAAKRMRKAG